MALDSYANLKTAIADWLHRTDLTSAIPDYITLAEAQIQRRIAKGLQDGKSLPRAMMAKSSITLDSEYVNLPSDFLGMVDLYIESEATRLDYLSADPFNRIKEKRGDSPVSSNPLRYTIIASQLQLVPVPDTSYAGTITYWQKFTALSGSNASNWILTNHPDVYLFGALTQSAPYLKDDARTQTWGTLFVTALEDMMTADPVPADTTILSADDALVFRPRRISFDINTGQ